MPNSYETVETVRIASADLANLLRERDALRSQVSSLQAEGSRMVNAQLSRTVRAFHQKFGHPVAWTPKVPDEATVRFRLALITEEYLELVEATFRPDGDSRAAADMLRLHVKAADVDVNLPEFIDALADLDYVIEGGRTVFGVDGAPIAAEVQRSNLSKDPVLNAHGEPIPHTKPTKPPGWTPPRIRECLIAQGWKP